MYLRCIANENNSDIDNLQKHILEKTILRIPHMIERVYSVSTDCTSVK